MFQPSDTGHGVCFGSGEFLGDPRLCLLNAVKCHLECGAGVRGAPGGRLRYWACTYGRSLD